MADCRSGALVTRPSTMAEASMLGTRMATASAKSTSTRWKAFGPCYDLGCGRTAASRRRSCLTILPCSSSSTMPSAEAKPCSAPFWRPCCPPPRNPYRALAIILGRGQMDEAVVDVVHAHDRRGSLGGGQGRGVEPLRGFDLDRPDHRGVARRDRRCQGGAPGLPRRQGRAVEDARQVELEVLGIVRQPGLQRVDGHDAAFL